MALKQRDRGAKTPCKWCSRGGIYINRATARNEMITSLFAKTYEDNVSGKLSDEMYMELSHKYEVERFELKTKIFEYKERLAKISEMEQIKDDFLKAVRKFMEMDSLTAPMLRELIDHIDVYEKKVAKRTTLSVL